MDDVINYVMETPGNTNPNVLRGLLGKSGGGGNILVANIIINEQAGTAALDKTWREIYDADFTIIKIDHNSSMSFAYIMEINSDEYSLSAVSFSFTSSQGISVQTEGMFFQQILRTTILK